MDKPPPNTTSAQAPAFNSQIQPQPFMQYPVPRPMPQFLSSHQLFSGQPGFAQNPPMPQPPMPHDNPLLNKLLANMPLYPSASSSLSPHKQSPVARNLPPPPPPTEPSDPNSDIIKLLNEASVRARQNPIQYVMSPTQSAQPSPLSSPPLRLSPTLPHVADDEDWTGTVIPPLSESSVILPTQLKRQLEAKEISKSPATGRCITSNNELVAYATGSPDGSNCCWVRLIPRSETNNNRRLLKDQVNEITDLLFAGKISDPQFLDSPIHLLASISATSHVIVWKVSTANSFVEVVLSVRIPEAHRIVAWPGGTDQRPRFAVVTNRNVYGLSFEPSPDTNQSSISAIDIAPDFFLGRDTWTFSSIFTGKRSDHIFDVLFVPTIPEIVCLACHDSVKVFDHTQQSYLAVKTLSDVPVNDLHRDAIRAFHQILALNTASPAFSSAHSVDGDSVSGPFATDPSLSRTTATTNQKSRIPTMQQFYGGDAESLSGHTPSIISNTRATVDCESVASELESIDQFDSGKPSGQNHTDDAVSSKVGCEPDTNPKGTPSAYWHFLTSSDHGKVLAVWQLCRSTTADHVTENSTISLKLLQQVHVKFRNAQHNLNVRVLELPAGSELNDATVFVTSEALPCLYAVQVHWQEEPIARSDSLLVPRLHYVTGFKCNAITSLHASCLDVSPDRAFLLGEGDLVQTTPSKSGSLSHTQVGMGLVLEGVLFCIHREAVTKYFVRLNDCFAPVTFSNRNDSDGERDVDGDSNLDVVSHEAERESTVPRALSEISESRLSGSESDNMRAVDDDVPQPDSFPEEEDEEEDPDDPEEDGDALQPLDDSQCVREGLQGSSCSEPSDEEAGQAEFVNSPETPQPNPEEDAVPATSNVLSDFQADDDRVVPVPSDSPEAQRCDSAQNDDALPYPLVPLTPTDEDSKKRARKKRARRRGDKGGAADRDAAESSDHVGSLIGHTAMTTSQLMLQSLLDNVPEIVERALQNALSQHSTTQRSAIDAQAQAVAQMKECTVAFAEFKGKGMTALITKIEQSVTKAVRQVQSSTWNDKTYLSLAKALVPTIAQTLTEVFSKTVVPAHEEATRRMFAQINDAFEKGIKEKLKELVAKRDIEAIKQALSPQMTVMQESIEKLNGQIDLIGQQVTVNGQAADKKLGETHQELTEAYRNLSQEVRKQSETINQLAQQMDLMFKLVQSTLNGNGVAGATHSLEHSHRLHAPSSQPTAMLGSFNRMEVPAFSSVRPADHTTLEIEHLLSLGNFNDAFFRVLEAKDMELLVWLCTRVQQSYPMLLANAPSPLSQCVLLSLFQQLAFSMHEHTNLKLKWIQDCLLILNVNDPTIRRHAGQVLTEVMNITEKQLAFLEPNNPHVSALRIVQALGAVQLRKLM
eukprot:c9392_g1_i2.p1 GENE.c9392_g1_i2~~c9392_g1_i2.p1  ORF type:complete len:1382 (-),score=413.16 c9392_g1_i2:41-4186(-)